MVANGRIYLGLFIALSALPLSGCSATGASQTSAYSSPRAALKVCSGFGCTISDRYALTEAELQKLASIMQGVGSAADEREAIRTAIAWLENTSQKRLRLQRDVEKAYQRDRGRRGQMDCVDESLNTTGYLSLMQKRGLLKHHRVRRHYAERGLLIDGRYPHKSAVIIDNSETSWTVDSWYEPGGGKPQVMPLSKWRKVRDSTA